MSRVSRDRFVGVGLFLGLLLLGLTLHGHVPGWADVAVPGVIGVMALIVYRRRYGYGHRGS